MEQENNTRNLILAFVLIMGFMFVWQIFVMGPRDKARKEALQAEQARIASEKAAEIEASPPASGGELNLSAENENLPDVRVPIEAAGLDGSINLRGARLDQLRLKDYYETIADKEAKNREGEIELFRPEGEEYGFLAFAGWQIKTARGEFNLDENARWQLVSGETLTPETPITLKYSNSADTLQFLREISVDEHFMFTVTDTVTNKTGSALEIHPYSELQQFGEPARPERALGIHRGFVGVAGTELTTLNYKNMNKGKSVTQITDNGGWAGLTTKYWLGAVIPEQDQPFKIVQSIESNKDFGTDFIVRAEGANIDLAPGASTTYTSRIFGGAKRSKVLRGYEDELGLPRFEDAIDWGKMFFWLTKPFFFVLSFINGYVGNFGVSILIFTVLVKAVFFPVQNRAYQSMAKMRELAEPMKRIRETVDDKQEQQRQLAELYREKKVNPVAGCLPIFLQMPVFYALFKTLNVTIEMRHEPFFGWIRDLSAPDPSAIGNLFGLIPISTDALASIPLLSVVLTIGFFPVLYGLTMWALQSLSPPPTDDTQKMIFAFLPLIFTFMFAGFAAGLVIYWCWSNILSIAQQYVIMRQNGQKTQLDKFIEARLGKGEAKN